MDLYFGGSEQKSWRDLLQREGVECVSLSYVGLLRRITKPETFRVADHYPRQKVHLDSGAFSLNRDPGTSETEARELAEGYYRFVQDNIGDVEFASEFDAVALGDHVRETRETFWKDMPPEKFLPVWHGADGPGELERLAAGYPRVGVAQGDTGGDMTPLLRGLAPKTRLHGIAMTRMDAMKAIPWSSVGSTSWLSTIQYGDTFVWDGRRMHRYPKKMKDKARKEHRSWLRQSGFDVRKIEADDNEELLRLSVWSWQHYASSLGTGKVVTLFPVPDDPGSGEDEDREAATPAGDSRNAELTRREEKKVLPGLGIDFREPGGDEDGDEPPEPHLITPAASLLQCDTCFLKEKCPAMTPGSECVYEIPVQIRTTRQLASLQDSLIEMQAQRVLFARMIEQFEGGYPDTNLSSEIDRLNRMVKVKADTAREGFSVRIEGSSPAASSGMISRIFGKQVAEKMGELPETVDPAGIIDAEVIGEDKE